MQATVVFCDSLSKPVQHITTGYKDTSSPSCSANSIINNETQRFLFDGLVLSLAF